MPPRPPSCNWIASSPPRIPTVADPASSVPAAAAPALSIANVRSAYPQAQDQPSDQPPSWIVDVRSLSLAQGEQLLLTGGSGVGKSTLLQLIAGLMDPVEGRIDVAGRNIHALKGHDRDLYRGRTVGMIFQTFNLLHGFSALENVMVAMMFSAIPRAEHRPRAEQLLKHLGITRIDADPGKLSIEAGSGGIAVARGRGVRPGARARR